MTKAKKRLRLEINSIPTPPCVIIYVTLRPLKNYPLQVVNVTGAVKTPGNRLWNWDCLVETRKPQAAFCAHTGQGVREAELGKGDCDRAEAEPLGLSEAGMALRSGPELRRSAKLLNPCGLSPGRGATLWAMPMEGDSWGGTQLWSVTTPHSQQLQGWSFHSWGGIWAALWRPLHWWNRIWLGTVALRSAWWCFPLLLNDYYYFHCAEEDIESQS